LDTEVVVVIVRLEEPEEPGVSETGFVPKDVVNPVGAEAERATFPVRP
jgi:hypothetical protein